MLSLRHAAVQMASPACFLPARKRSATELSTSRMSAAATAHDATARPEPYVATAVAPPGAHVAPDRISRTSATTMTTRMASTRMNWITEFSFDAAFAHSHCTPPMACGGAAALARWRRRGGRARELWGGRAPGKPRTAQHTQTHLRAHALKAVAHGACRLASIKAGRGLGLGAAGARRGGERKERAGGCARGRGKRTQKITPRNSRLGVDRRGLRGSCRGGRWLGRHRAQWMWRLVRLLKMRCERE